MKLITITTMLLMSATASAQTRTAHPVAAATPAARPAPAGGRCETLAREWRATEIDLANSYAEGVGDNSVPRLSLRAMETSNALATASMTLTLMQANHCPLPPHAPNHLTYMTGALACATLRMSTGRGANSAECDSNSWTRLGE